MKQLLSIILVGFAVWSIQAQEIKRNGSGEVIVTYVDGSWRYFMGSDSILLAQEYQEFLRFEDEMARRADSIANLPVTIDEIKEESESSIEENIELKNWIVELERKKARLAERLRRVEAGFLVLTDKELSKTNEEFEQIEFEIAMLNAEMSQNRILQVNPDKRAMRNRQKLAFKPVVFEWPKSECNVDVDRDERLNQLRAVCQSENIVRYTPEAAHNVLRNRNFVEIDAALTRAGGQTYLILQLKMYAEDGQNPYGVLEEGAELEITFISGQVLAISNILEDVGQIDPTEPYIHYTGQYGLDKKILKQIEKNGIDKILINWSNGDEIYPVYDIFLLTDQLRCIDKILKQ